MITKYHNDGVCFKVTLVYTDFEDSEPFEPMIFYGESYDECFNEIVARLKKFEEDGKYLVQVLIQDDSK